MAGRLVAAGTRRDGMGAGVQDPGAGSWAGVGIPAATGTGNLLPLAWRIGRQVPAAQNQGGGGLQWALCPHWARLTLRLPTCPTRWRSLSHKGCSSTYQKEHPLLQASPGELVQTALTDELLKHSDTVPWCGPRALSR